MSLFVDEFLLRLAEVLYGMAETIHGLVRKRRGRAPGATPADGKGKHEHH